MLSIPHYTSLLGCVERMTRHDVARARRVRLRVTLSFIVGLIAMLTRPAASSVQLPPDFIIESPVAFSNFAVPVALTFLPDGRWLVAEKAGRVIVVESRIPLVTPFIDLSAEVLSDGDRGLTGITVDPEFATNRFVYLLYTVDPDSNGVDDDPIGFGRLVRYQASAADPHVADPTSRTVLMGTDWLDAPPSGMTSHTVDDLRWGADGTLLVSIGDGAGDGDAGGLYPNVFLPGRVDPMQDIGSFRAASLASLDGKVLRLDPSTGHGAPGNPYYDPAQPGSVASRIWARGFRNPYRFTVRPGTGSPNPADGDPGTLYIGEVGWATWEEVNVASEGGLHFGWPCYEGDSTAAFFQSATPSSYGCGSPENRGPCVGPALVYNHVDSTLGTPPGFRGSAVIGGPFYTGTSYPAAYRGGYFFVDFVRGVIRHATFDGADQVVGAEDFASGLNGPVYLTADPLTNDLVYIDILTNQIRSIRYAPPSNNLPPVALGVVVPDSGIAPLTVQFTSAGSFDPDGDPITASWSFGDSQGSTDANPQHTYLLPGLYRATLTIRDGRGGVGRDTLSVNVQPPAPNTSPDARIDAPADSGSFAAGDRVALRGSAIDAENPATALGYRWEVDLHHNVHVHPHSYVFSGDTASFIAEDHDDGSGAWYEIRFIVTDSGGSRDTAIARIDPEIDLEPSPVSIAPNPPITGARARLAFRIDNHGRMLARSSHWILRAGTTALAEGDTAIAGLGSVAIALEFPLDVSAGTVDLNVTADATDVLRETSESNNTSHTSVAISAPPPFPSTPVLDRFNRANGPLTAPWVGDLTDLSLESRSLRTTTSSKRTPLWGSTYGPDQEAFVTFKAFGSSSSRHGLVLKAQGTDTNSERLEVRYESRNVYVCSYTLGTGWVTHGVGIPVRLLRDDVLGTRAFANGTVSVLRNGQELGSVSVASWPFARAGGRIGVVLERATSARLDNFGGGSLASATRPAGNVPIGRSDDSPPLSSADRPGTPATLALSAPRPNPARTGITLSLDLPERAPLRWTVSDIQGRTVWSESRLLDAGRWELRWPGSDASGRPQRPGLYFARVVAGERVFLRRFVLAP